MIYNYFNDDNYIIFMKDTVYWPSTKECKCGTSNYNLDLTSD